MAPVDSIDVLLPVRNARRSLPWALRDVLAQQGVALRVFAVVDVGPEGHDDGSGDWLREQARREPRLIVMDGAGQGAGAALQRALDASRSPLVSHMEADDRCPPDRLARLSAALGPGLDAVTSRVGQIGARTAGMRRYLDWQNGLLDGAQMSAARFIEIPALHQTGLYRRQALTAAGGYRVEGPWPVDIDFWLRWFERGLTVAKLPRVLYHWRQHPRQSTRSGGPASLANLRAAKVAALARLHGRRGLEPARLHLVSTGATLAVWSAALAEADIELASVLPWKPGRPLPVLPADDILLAVYGMATTRERLQQAVQSQPNAPRLVFAA